MNAQKYETIAFPKNNVTIIIWCKYSGPCILKAVTICVTGCIKYVQYVNRLKGKNAGCDKNELIGSAKPHLHDKVIQIKAKPQAKNG